MKETSTQTVVGAITDAILLQRLAPGTRLGETELASISEVGRTVIRQALIRLSQSKLVRIEHNRGASVAQPTEFEIHEAFEALATIECAAMEKFAGTMTASDVQRLHQHLSEQRVVHQRSNVDLEYRLGPDFHLLVVQMARHRTLEAIHASLIAQERLFTSFHYDDFDQGHLCRDHEEIIGFLQAGEVARAQTLMKGHYRTLEGFCLGHKVKRADLPLHKAPVPEGKSDEPGQKGQVVQLK
ncbi:GntR family transcriptional regulator [Paraburkholderia sediminicola]|uniref:GntR family transcriptional regulator n=1 Tax=Paraburkholderia sediminicola TaxID=458836 RepID=UPI0038BD8317